VQAYLLDGNSVEVMFAADMSDDVNIVVLAAA
jgi:hypothetical protein